MAPAKIITGVRQRLEVGIKVYWFSAFLGVNHRTIPLNIPKLGCTETIISICSVIQRVSPVRRDVHEVETGCVPCHLAIVNLFHPQRVCESKALINVRYTSASHIREFILPNLVIINKRVKWIMAISKTQAGFWVHCRIILGKVYRDW